MSALKTGPVGGACGRQTGSAAALEKNQFSSEGGLGGLRAGLAGPGVTRGRGAAALALLGESMAEMVWPTRCCHCNGIGEVLCEHCRAELPLIDASSACPECGAPFGDLVCCACADAHPEAGLSAAQQREFSMGLFEPPRFPFTAARCACSFTGVASSLVHAYKDADEVRLAPIIAGIWVDALGPWLEWADVLVPIPTTREALRRRGFNHLLRVARLVAAGGGLPLVQALVSSKSLDQRHLSAMGREANLASSFALAPSVLYAGGAGERDGPDASWSNCNSVRDGPGATWDSCDAEGEASSTHDGCNNVRDGPGAVWNDCTGERGTSGASWSSRRNVRDGPGGSDDRKLYGFGDYANGCSLEGTKVLLIDDVMTTGATLSSATRVLLAAGAAEVRVSAFARVW